MPVATPEQYLAMLDAASEQGYAYAAVNVTSSQTVNAALRGFAEAGADGILQITTGGASYLSAGDEAAGARALVAFTREVAGSHPVLAALHTDHCPPDHLDGFLQPLLEESVARRGRGEQPLFNSHMFDGSTLPLEENLRISRDLLGRCARADVVLEVECGVVGGEEDGVSGQGASQDRLYTTPEDLLRVAEALGTGERGRYLVAATFGNVHGVYAPGHVRLRPEILGEGQEALARRHPGARFQYVFHGSSGSSQVQIREAVQEGVVKLNLDTDAQYAFTRAIADHVLANRESVLSIEGGKRAYDPRSWGREAEQAMAARVAEACRQLGSAGRSLVG
ncbi:MAG TPA: class II fructose-bisphosphate aldolase [Thermoleophilaceae bacterium]|nr:class II fructose-bisphosphate aldolase [Thermoleophilaceae bacterium]